MSYHALYRRDVLEYCIQADASFAFTSKGNHKPSFFCRMCCKIYLAKQIKIYLKFSLYNKSNLFLIPKYNIKIKNEIFGATIFSRYARMNIFLSEFISDNLRILGVVEMITAL